MKLEFSPLDAVDWIKQSDFEKENPLNCIVDEVVKLDNEYLLVFKTYQGLRKVSLWRKTKIEFCLKHSTETENWKGKTFRIGLALNPKTSKFEKTFYI